jgi:hypothetical protein
VSGSKNARALQAEELLSPGEVATIYFDSRTVSVVSMTALPTDANLLSCRDEAGKVTLIDGRSISAVIRQRLDREIL